MNLLNLKFNLKNALFFIGGIFASQNVLASEKVEFLLRSDPGKLVLIEASTSNYGDKEDYERLYACLWLRIAKETLEFRNKNYIIYHTISDAIIDKRAEKLISVTYSRLVSRVYVLMTDTQGNKIYSAQKTLNWQKNSKLTLAGECN